MEEKIEQKLDKLINLLALNITLGKKQEDQIKILSRSGFQPKEIAKILGTTANTVRVGLSRSKSK